jgi:hypothetical protein
MVLWEESVPDGCTTPVEGKIAFDGPIYPVEEAVPELFPLEESLLDELIYPVDLVSALISAGPKIVKTTVTKIRFLNCLFIFSF